MSRRTFIPGIALALLLAGCGGRPAATPTATEPPPTATLTAVPPTLAPTDIPTATVAPTPTAYTPFKVSVASANNANLRSGPGSLFPFLRVLNQNSSLMLLGQTPGGEWFYLQVTQTLKGWVFGKLLRQDPNLAQAPVIEPAGVRLIQGRVLDAEGTPVSGITFGVLRRAAPTNPGNFATTDSAGVFRSYMPSSASGVWTVSFLRAECDSNAWKDSACTVYKAPYQGVLSPPAQDVRLPQTDPLAFTWK
jgi:hypothetical protein